MRAEGQTSIPGGTLTGIPLPTEPVTYAGGLDLFARIEAAHARRASSSPFAGQAKPEFTREQLIKAGFSIAPGRVGRTAVNRERDKRIVELYTDEGMSLREVADALHMSPAGIRCALERLDVQVRTKAGTKKRRRGPAAGGAVSKDLSELLASNGVTTAEVRAWGRANDQPVGAHGSISRAVIEAYLLHVRHLTTTQKEISA